MSRVEYSDFYKFITSVGVALIALSVIVPWLFLREPFDLLQPQDKINLLTPLAQSIIQNRQFTVQTILNLIPYFSLITLGLGLCIVIVGGRKWFLKTQKLLDEQNELNLETLKKQLGASSPREAKERREEDAKAQIENEEEKKGNAELREGDLLQPSEITSLATKSYRTERRIAELLETCFSKTYTILMERHLGPVALDIVVASKNRSYGDRIIEVKYIRIGFKYNWLRDNVLKVVYANQLYQRETQRLAEPILFIVGESKSVLPSSTVVQSYRSRIESELKKLDTKATVAVMTEEELDETDCEKIKTLLGV